MQVASHVSLHTRDLHSLTLFSPKGPFGSLLVAWGWEHFVASLIPSSWLNCGGWVGTRHCSVPTMAWFERGWHAGDLQSMTVTSPKEDQRFRAIKDQAAKTHNDQTCPFWLGENV